MIINKLVVITIYSLTKEVHVDQRKLDMTDAFRHRHAAMLEEHNRKLASLMAEQARELQSMTDAFHRALHEM
jgi:hypothetical protein